MINTQFIEDVMKEFPAFDYELIPTPNPKVIELKIEKDNVSKSGIGYRKITKTIMEGDDLSVLKNVLKGRES